MLVLPYFFETYSTVARVYQNPAKVRVGAPGLKMALRKEETLTKSVAKTASSHMLSFLLPDLSKLRWIVRPRIGKSDPITIKTVRNHRQPRWASTRARASCSTAKLDDAPAWFFCEETSVSVIVELLNYPRSFRD